MGDAAQTMVELEVLVSLLSRAVGESAARQAVHDTARELALGRGPLSSKEALSILDRIGARPGVIGVTARFAKSRLHLSSR